MMKYSYLWKSHCKYTGVKIDGNCDDDYHIENYPNRSLYYE